MHLARTAKMNVFPPAPGDEARPDGADPARRGAVPEETAVCGRGRLSERGQAVSVGRGDGSQPHG